MIENITPRIVLLTITGLILIFGINSFSGLSSAITTLIINFILMLLIMGGFVILTGMMLIRSEWNELVRYTEVESVCDK